MCSIPDLASAHDTNARNPRSVPDSLGDAGGSDSLGVSGAGAVPNSVYTCGLCALLWFDGRDVMSCPCVKRRSRARWGLGNVDRVLAGRDSRGAASAPVVLLAVGLVLAGLVSVVVGSWLFATFSAFGGRLVGVLG